MEGSEVIIEAKELTKVFNGLTAVDHVNFKVRKGEIFGFLGPNGAGKTTTINMLITLLKPRDKLAVVTHVHGGEVEYIMLIPVERLRRLLGPFLRELMEGAP